MKGDTQGGVGLWTRESLLSIGAAALGVSALIVFAGTSLPIVSNSTVDPSFYDSSNLPVAVVLGLLIGLSLLVQYRLESGKGLLRRSLAAILIAAGGVGVLVVAGLDQAQLGVLAFASLFALAVSVRHGFRLMKDRPLLVGGALAHIGVAVMLLAIIGSGPYGRKSTMSLPLGEPREVHGATLTFRQHTVDEDGKHRLVISVERDGKVTELTPRMFLSSYNNSLMREPDYATVMFRDFYVEPVSLEQAGSGHDHAHGTLIELRKGETKIHKGVSVAFAGFEMGQHQDGDRMAQGGMTVGAVLEVRQDGKMTRLVPKTLFRQGSAPSPTRVRLGDGPLEFELTNLHVGMDGESSRIQLTVFDGTEEHAHEPPAEILVVEASIKPFMLFVWIGAGLILTGILLAGVNRWREHSMGARSGDRGH